MAYYFIQWQNGEKKLMQIQANHTWIYVKNFGWNCIKNVLLLNDGYDIISENVCMHQVIGNCIEFHAWQT